MEPGLFLVFGAVIYGVGFLVGSASSNERVRLMQLQIDILTRMVPEKSPHPLAEG